MITEKDIDDIASELLGTANSLDDVLEARGFNYDDVPTAMFLRLDSQTLLCEQCGWWCEPSEMQDSVCNECDDQ